MGVDLTWKHEAIRNHAERLAGGPGTSRSAWHCCTGSSGLGGNHAFPEVALHGALWAYGFYERRGAVSRTIAYRYFYDADERARRAYMLFRFSQGFKEANRSVFVDTYANYLFAKRHGEAPGADEILAPALLEALNRVHEARRAGRQLRERERAEVFETALLLYEQEQTVGPKIREEVARFDCPILAAIVLRPVVRFAYFPRATYLAFRNFGDTDERIAKAVRSLQLAERVGWPRVSRLIGQSGVLPLQFESDPLAYSSELGAELG